MANPSGHSRQTDARISIALLALILAAGFALRWAGISERSLSHPEIYAPGVSLSEETATPPPRHGFVENLQWHFSEEPHPVGWYMAMWGWTSLAGDGSTALRAPSVIFGTGVALLAYLFAAPLYGRRAALIAAALIAFSGFQIYWGGMARMYAPGAFLGLASSMLLFRIASDSRAGLASKILYVAATAAALQTTELNWGLFGVQVFWTTIFAADRAAMAPGARHAALPTMQAVVLAISTPALLQAALTARGGAADPPSAMFLVHYLSLGAAFEPDEQSDPMRFVPAAIVAAGALFSLAFACMGMMRRTALSRLAPAAGLSLVAIAGVTLAGVAFSMWLASIAPRRGAALMILALIPFGGFLFALIAGEVRALIRRFLAPVERIIASIDPYTAFLALAGIAAPVAALIISIWKPVTEFRAFIVFVPYFACLIAAGMAQLASRRIAFTMAVLAAGALLAVSIVHAKARPASPRDYKGIAAAMIAASDPGDVFLIRRFDWMDAPVTYYLPHDRIIGDLYAERLGAGRVSRVWLIRWAQHKETPADPRIRDALKDYEECERVEALRAAAILYGRRGAGACARGAAQ